MRSRIVSSTLIAVGVACLIIIAVIDVNTLNPWGLSVVAALVFGGLITWRVPSNSVGWLVLAYAVSSSFGAAVLSFAVEFSDPTVAGWFDAVGNSLGTAGMLTLPAILLRFPAGAPLTPRWRLVEVVVAVAAITGGAAALLNGGWGGDIAQAVAISPLREATAPAGDVLSAIYYPAMAASMFLASASLIVRYRRSQGEDRLKVKWLAYAAGFVAAVMLLVLFASDLALSDAWAILLVGLAFASIPAAVGVAVLRYRLYDIDVVINRTVVLALLAGFITAVYALVVVGLGGVIGASSDGLVLPIAATALLAVVFEPVRQIAQRWANRLVYGQRATPYEVLSDLTERLAGSELGEGILSRMVALLGAGTGAERAAIWLGSPGKMEVGAVWPPDSPDRPTPALDDGSMFPVLHDGATVGALEVVKPRGSAFSSAERSLVSDLAGSAGLVLGYQRLNDSLAMRARELEESRHRLVEAQDLERRRLERDLHDGAQQLIVALKVKIGLAAQMAARHAAPDLKVLLDGLAEETQVALDEVRDLAKGIYPPVLESDGLGAAVAGLAAGAPVPVVVARDGVGRYPREVEVAVFFNVSEAVTNAVKHATPPIRVTLTDHAGWLRFEVSDSGPGFDQDRVSVGSGLENMADRVDALGGALVIESEVGVGTTVRGEVPLPVAAVGV